MYKLILFTKQLIPFAWITEGFYPEYSLASYPTKDNVLVILNPVRENDNL